MAYLWTTIVLWIVFLWLVPFKEWRKYYSVLIFSALLGTVSDLLGVVFHQWLYIGPTVGGLSLWSDLGIAPAEGGTFIRLFPQRKSRFSKGLYLLIWTVGNGFCEWVFVQAGWIGYHRWNPIKATFFYIFFFSAIWIQEYWYNGTGRFKNH